MVLLCIFFYRQFTLTSQRRQTTVPHCTSANGTGVVLIPLMFQHHPSVGKSNPVFVNYCDCDAGWPFVFGYLGFVVRRKCSFLVVFCFGGTWDRSIFYTFGYVWIMSVIQSCGMLLMRSAAAHGAIAAREAERAPGHVVVMEFPPCCCWLWLLLLLSWSLHCKANRCTRLHLSVLLCWL